jgi:enamine deaminase RidA (YjgF/YER057c/UK114 family)
MEGMMSAGNEFISPNTLPPTQGYSQVVKVRSGEMIFLSGQVGLTPGGQLAGADYGSQLEQAFRNIEAGLRAAGASMGDLIKINYFVSSSAPAADLLPAHIAIRDRYVNTATPPASAFVFVNRLARPEWLVEIEAVAAKAAP